jgi:hypothetical protein
MMKTSLRRLGMAAGFYTDSAGNTGGMLALP